MNNLQIVMSSFISTDQVEQVFHRIDNFSSCRLVHFHFHWDSFKLVSDSKVGIKVKSCLFVTCSQLTKWAVAQPNVFSQTRVSFSSLSGCV